MKTSTPKAQASNNRKPESKMSTDEDNEDKQFLTSNENDIEKILRLIEDRTDHAEAERRLSEAQSWVDARKKGTVFHQHIKGNRKIALNHHTSNLIKLSAALELTLTTLDYKRDLHAELDTHLEKRIEVLQRIKKRRVSQS